MRSTRCPFMLLLHLVLHMLCHTVQSMHTFVTFYPKYIHQLKENKRQNLTAQVSYIFNESDGAWLKKKYGSEWPGAHVRLYSEKSDLARVVQPNTQNISLDCEQQLESESTLCVFNASFEIEGVFLGKTSFRLQASYAGHRANKSVDVWVVRDAALKTTLFVATLGVLIVLANVGMGCELNLDTVVEVVKKPLAPIVGLGCQFILMPLIAYGIAIVLFKPVGLLYLGLGIFTAGCSPSGGASNVWTVLLEGNLDLSISMTFLSTIGAFVVMPTWMFTLGRHFLSDISGETIRVPYRNIFVSVVILVVPLLTGVAIRRYKKNLAERIRKLLRPFLLLTIVFICTFGVYASWYMFLVLDWRILLAGMLLPWSGFGFGLIASLLFRQPLNNVIAISIETGVQNSGIAIVLLQVSFGQPDADLAAVAPVAMSMFTPFPLLLAYIVRTVRKCGDKSKQNTDEQTEGAPDNPTLEQKAGLIHDGHNIVDI